MIITPEDQASKLPSDSKAPIDDGLQVRLEEPPPSYSSQADSEDSVAISSQALPLARTFNTKPTNFLSLFNEHDTIRGEFVIDPSIRIPSSMLPPLGDGKTEDDRKHLSLRSKFSSVHAEIWLLGSPRDSVIDTHKFRRTTIALTSNHGSIRAQVQTMDGAAPFSLTATATHGSIRLALPRSFQGLLSLSTRHGSIAVSDLLVQNATQLSQVGTTRRYFIGDFQLLGENEWQGDQAEIDAVHGYIRVKYIDELGEGRRRKKGLLSRLFGK
ncbi:hypothetical protein J3R82DRAFT_6784 [Butyriboletus roseoflavus]|nr:hypothetical protein J3R82DRAFT_6784 [Butyriboletus roseoflavus]